MNDLLSFEDILPTDKAPLPRKPRVALMGEFSAGKSTLANLMMGSDPLPMQVSATQLPPVWISYGAGDPYRLTVEGTRAQCTLAQLTEMSVDDTAFIRLFSEEDILELCDIVDTPGISDPNMSSETWERVVPFVDAIIWCSPATQAWRQSEAAVWETIPDKVKQNSVLLLTRADMIVQEHDRQRVLKRIRRETEGAFAACLMISLTQARDAEDQSGELEQSGAEPFVSKFLEILDRLSGQLGNIETVQPSARLEQKLNAQTGVVHSAETPENRIIPRKPVALNRSSRPVSNG